MNLQDIESVTIDTWSASLPELYDHVRASGLLLLEVNCSQASSKQDFLATLAKGIDMPREFSQNWDAMADALTDLSWHKNAEGFVLLFTHSKELALSDKDRDILQELLEDAIDFWQQHNTAFWVFYA